MTNRSTTGGDEPPIIVNVHRAAPDELVPHPFGLERAAASKLVASGELRTRKLGRKTYARRSAVLALVDAAPPKPANDEPDPLEALAARTRGRR